jgi:hypothetical protein
MVGGRNAISPCETIYYHENQVKQLQPYVHGLHPFHSKKISDVAPPNYEINLIAGTGGYVSNMVSDEGTLLALALDDNSELEDRKYRENMRMDIKNPLSASFASKMEKYKIKNLVMQSIN